MTHHTIVIMAGGTGGHIFPALAIARQLADLGYQISWLGAQSGMETKLVPEAGWTLDVIAIKNVRGKGILRWCLLPWRLMWAIAGAYRILKRRRPALVVGMGGYVSGPGAIAAKLAGIPLIIHEQNAVCGLTNRYLAKIADRVLLGMPGSLAQNAKVIYTGNPVRPEIAALGQQNEEASHHPLRLLVIGGSLGAQIFNEVVPHALALLTEEQRPQVWQQTGERQFVMTKSRFSEVNIKAEISPFIADMAQAYAWADLVLCRSGALTVAELSAANKPAILVPLPIAVDDHQRKNAEVLVAAQGALLVLQADFTPQHLASLLAEFMTHPERVKAMHDALKALPKSDSTSLISNLCRQLIEEAL